MERNHSRSSINRNQQESIENISLGVSSGKSKVYYNGMPKTLLKKQSSAGSETKVDKDKLSYAKAKWL
jgi:hypothetical protein